MSVFGGDSWAREAQYRKRRVDDLIVDGLDHDGSSYKKLCSGKYACLVCPHNPIFDTPLMLSIHIKGSRHCAAEARLKERELRRKDEINKRIALSQNSIATANTGASTQHRSLASKPLIEQTRKAAFEILHNKTPQQSVIYETQDVKSSKGHITYETSTSDCKGSFVEIKAAAAAAEEVMKQQSDFRERRERELKFTAAGWKRNCHGGWFRDENVEFDSDEEDPNVSLA